MIHLDITKKLVVLGLTGRNLRRAQSYIGRLAAELEAVAIEVVTVAGDETQGDVLRITADQAQLERFMHRQEVAVVTQGRGTERGTGAVVEQASGESRAGQQQKQQEKQAAHGGLARSNVGA
ncbi:hypothetical protein PS623_04518 [Pseudomonas fluorescens]|nr:hypothetical protein PS623_04518 [Pseudomonas fluorescens]